MKVIVSELFSPVFLIQPPVPIIVPPFPFLILNLADFIAFSSLNFIRNRSKDLYGEQVRPKIIEKYCREGDEKAKNIYNEFGNNLGIVLSHAVNMFDPNVIIIGGGLSKAFDCFKDSMLLSLDKHSYSFSKNSIEILESKLKESSIMRGACLMVKNVKGL